MVKLVEHMVLPELPTGILGWIPDEGMTYYFFDEDIT